MNKQIKEELLEEMQNLSVSLSSIDDVELPEIYEELMFILDVCIEDLEDE